MSNGDPFMRMGAHLSGEKNLPYGGEVLLFGEEAFPSTEEVLRCGEEALLYGVEALS